jgi:PIN domain nuclease of toxin-antitoxin system
MPPVLRSKSASANFYAKQLRKAMRDETNEIIVSSATIWEIAIKRAIGKLRFDRPIVAGVLALGFEILPVAGAHAEHAGRLPPHHNDPFDRLIIAQAISRGWPSARRTGICSPTGS